MKKLAYTLAVGLAVPMVAAAPALAEYPEKPVTIIVPYPAGGTTDVLARIIAEELSERLGEPFVVENRAGGGGSVGMAMLAQTAADGYTLGAASILTHGIQPALRDDLPYDALEDFTPVSLLADTPNVLLANVDSEFHSVQDVIAYAEENPGDLDFGSTSITGSPHMSGELLKALAGIDMVHVPYQGGGPLLGAVMGGEIPLGFDNLPSASGHIRAGSLRALAVTTTERWSEHPDIPTFQEAGVEGYDVTAWFGIVAPAEVPDDVISILESHIAEALADEGTRQRLADIGASAVGSTSAEFGQRMKEEVARWQEVVERVDIDLE